MDNNELPADYWADRVSHSCKKDDLPPDIWDRICKIRNSPIQLVKDVIIGDLHKPQYSIS